MNKLAIVVAAFAVMAVPAAADAAACRNAQGHFIKCPPAPAAHAPAPAASRAASVRPALHATAAPARRAPCRDAKTGRFKKC